MHCLGAKNTAVDYPIKALIDPRQPVKECPLSRQMKTPACEAGH